MQLQKHPDISQCTGNSVGEGAKSSSEGLHFDFFNAPSWHDDAFTGLLCNIVLRDAFSASFRLCEKITGKREATASYWRRKDRTWIRTLFEVCGDGAMMLFLSIGELDLVPRAIGTANPHHSGFVAHHQYIVSRESATGELYLGGGWLEDDPALLRALFWMGLEGSLLRRALDPAFTFTQESLWQQERARSWQRFGVYAGVSHFSVASYDNATWF
jgi:hypothetical protein